MKNVGDSSNRKIIIAVILTILIILALIGGYFLVKKIDNKRLNNAFALGYNKSVEDVAVWQTQTGDIFIWQNESIQTMNIQEICGGVAP